MPGSSGPSDKTPLETFVDDSVSRSLVKYFEDKGDPGKVLKPLLNEINCLKDFTFSYGGYEAKHHFVIPTPCT